MQGKDGKNLLVEDCFNSSLRINVIHLATIIEKQKKERKKGSVRNAPNLQADPFIPLPLLIRIASVSNSDKRLD